MPEVNCQHFEAVERNSQFCTECGEQLMLPGDDVGDETGEMGDNLDDIDLEREPTAMPTSDPTAGPTNDPTTEPSN